MRDLAHNNRWPQIPFRPVVCRLNAVFGEKRQHADSVVSRAYPVQQPLIVFIAENPVQEGKGEFAVEFFYLYPALRCVQFVLFR